MKSRLIAAAAGAAALSLASGCATVTYSSQGALDGVVLDGAAGPASQQVFISTTGHHMFWSIPLTSGDIRWNPETQSINGGFVFFRDLVGVEEVQEALLKIAESRNCDLVGVSFSDDDTSYAGASYGGIIGAFFGSSRISVSAVLVPRRNVQQ